MFCCVPCHRQWSFVEFEILSKLEQGGWTQSINICTFFSLYDDDDIWKVWVSGRQQKMSLTPSVVREIIQGKTFRNDILGTTTTWIVVKEHKNKTNIIAAQGISLSLNSPLSSHLLSSFHFYDWQCGIYFLHITVKWDITNLKAMS